MTDEHVRYAKLMATIASAEAVNPDFARQFALRSINDADQVMGESALIALINDPRVDDSVLDALEPLVPQTWTAALDHLRERRARLPLEEGDVDEALVLGAVDLGSRRLQLWLLDNIPLPHAALQSLASDGVTKAIRNRAKQRLASR